ncbi:MAG: radical SAM protein [Microthrixaceae bacterium]
MNGFDGRSPVLCKAPMASMYFDNLGKVRACCQNSVSVMGDVTRQSLRQIWDGAEAASLRSALGTGTYPPGCELCRWMDASGNPDLVYARNFDDLSAVDDTWFVRRRRVLSRRWPQQMEFSISNACNLQCVMCSGEFSSAIRVHREHLPALPTVYGERFFAELAEFLPHLDRVKVLGGEPFLAPESLRLLDLLAGLARIPRISLTTNATQWNARVESILGRLPIDLVVSLDGVRPETYEAIRVGARLDVVLANLDRYRAAATARGRELWLAHCLMTHNWSEFPDFLRFAEDRALPVGINVVQYPNESSLYQQDAAYLVDVLEVLGTHDHLLTSQLTGSRLDAWRSQLRALRAHLDSFALPAEQRLAPTPYLGPSHGPPGDVPNDDPT